MSFQFEPRLTRNEALRLAREFDVENDEAAQRAGRRLSGEPNVEDFRLIFEWKTRGRGRSRLYENSDGEIVDALSLALKANTPRSSIAVLRGLHGVDVPVASAIMAMMQPNVHTVIDFRALEALSYDGTYNQIAFYLRYRCYCVELSRRWGLSLRELDRALWQWSSEESKRLRARRKR
ncbi:unnamed protein product [Phaeothamnion confervicola]